MGRVRRAEAVASAGLVTRQQLVGAGVSPRVAEREVAAGRWQRPALGVYVTHARPLRGLDLGRTAAALAGGRVVLSGLVPLRELELRWLPPDDRVLALVDSELRTPSSGRVVLRRTTGPQPRDLAARRPGLAPVARAVVDAGRELDRLRDVRGVVLGAVADGWADVTELAAHLATTQRNGSGLTRRAVLDAGRGCASPPEAELVDALIGAGRPFYVNPELRLHGRLLGVPDVWFPGVGLGGEVESVERHGSAGDVESTYDRHERMAAAGIELVHLSVRRIRRDAAEAAGYVLGRAWRRVAAGDREPPGLVVLPRGPLLR
jgi:hypothetical protein